jgi:Dolichyl-phosphate-mannose-protein mannosyltransferase
MSDTSTNPRLRIADCICIFLIQVVFWALALSQYDVPGLYMDGINPDYFAAIVLNPEIKNSAWLIPFKGIPLLGNLYHGVQNLYIGLPIYGMLGTNIFSARIATSLAGALIVVLAYLCIYRLSASRLLALLATLALATDPSFIYAFRMQSYIILGGAAWLMAALYCLSKPTGVLGKKILIVAGIFYGLAVYGYFVFLFFAPALFLYGAITCYQNKSTKPALYFLLGVLVGLLPYILGYLSLYIKLGGLGEFLKFVGGSVGQLDPLASGQGGLERIRYVIDIAGLALSGVGNELMFFGDAAYKRPLSNVALTYALLIGSGLNLLLAISHKNTCQTGRLQYALWGLLPLSYLGTASLLGDRLWAHHFSILLPLFYVSMALLMTQVLSLLGLDQARRPTAIYRMLVVAILLPLISINLIRDSQLLSYMQATGGKGKMSSALTQLAQDAMAQAHQKAYLFPEWGFYMPFVFETANSVISKTDLNPQSIDALKLRLQQFELLFWEEKDTAKYIEQLKTHGLVSPNLKTYVGRDGKPAFYGLETRSP